MPCECLPSWLKGMPATRGGRTLAEETKLLKKRLINKKLQLRRLEDEHNKLRVQHQLLASITAALAEIRNNHAFGDADLRDLASEEAVLLQQLPGQGGMKQGKESSMSENSLQQHFLQEQALVETIARQDNPLHLFTMMMALPPYPVTETYPTVQDFCREYICMIGGLSLALQQHAAGPAALQFLQAGQIPLERIKAAMFRYLHLLYTLSRPSVLPNSETIGFQLCMMNIDTGQPLSESNPQQYAWVVRQLDLTRQQQMNIATGFDVFKRLIAHVMNEQRHASACEGAETGTSVPEAGSGSSSNTTGANSQQQEQQQPECSGAVPVQEQQQQQQQQQEHDFDHVANPFAHRRFLYLQQTRLQRLQISQRKEVLMRSLAAAYLWGCLTWEQMAKLHVLMFPIVPIPGMVAAAIARLEQSHM